MRTRALAVLAAIAALTVSGTALADVPPSPPCPPGYSQVSDTICAQPFICPNGWRLVAGPKCVPWTCSKADACDGKHVCVGTSLCVDAKGAATRFCDDARPCAAGQTCKPREVCSRGGGTGLGSLGSRGPFDNWDAAAALAPKPSATAAPAPSQSAIPAPDAAAPSAASVASAQPVAPRKSCALSPGSALALPLLALLWGLRRRR